MLSFEIKNSKAIQVYCDKDGLESLIRALENLRGSATHVHLRAPSAGGKELVEQSPWGGKVASEVTITIGGN